MTSRIKRSLYQALLDLDPIASFYTQLESWNDVELEDAFMPITKKSLLDGLIYFENDIKNKKMVEPVVTPFVVEQFNRYGVFLEPLLVLEFESEQELHTLLWNIRPQERFINSNTRVVASHNPMMTGIRGLELHNGEWYERARCITCPIPTPPEQEKTISPTDVLTWDEIQEMLMNSNRSSRE